MRVVQLSCFRDPLRRPGAALLEAWPTLWIAAEAAAGAGVEVSVVHAGWRDEIVERNGVRYHFVAEPGLERGGMAGRLAGLRARRLVARATEPRPDVVHLQGFGFPVQTRVVASTGVPVLVQDHADKVPHGWRKTLYRWGHARTAGAAFTAAAQAEPFLAARILSPRAPVFEVLESSSFFTPGDVESARRETGIGGDPCLLWVGRLDDNKDPLTVLDALSAAADRIPGARLWMAYHEASLKAGVRARIDGDARLRGRVTLLGRVPHARVETLCRAADFFVAASHREGSGYALLEALACGATPLATDIPSFRRVTRGGEVGALYGMGDREKLAELMAAWAAKDREALRRTAKAHFDVHLSPAAMGRELRAAYDAVAR